MARYLITAPAYVGGKYLGNGATHSEPTLIELPDGTQPSLTWQPVDEAALKDINALVEVKVKSLTEHLDPTKDKHSIDRITEATRKTYRKKLIEPPQPKQEIKELDTNSEMAAQTRKVIGRPSDRSPV